MDRMEEGERSRTWNEWKLEKKFRVCVDKREKGIEKRMTNELASRRTANEMVCVCAFICGCHMRVSSTVCREFNDLECNTMHCNVVC